MTSITLHLDDEFDRCKKITCGPQKGKWHLRIGNYEKYASTKEELEKDLIEFISMASSTPLIRVNKVGSEIAIHASNCRRDGACATWLYSLLQPDGHLRQRGGGSFQFGCIDEVAQDYLLHMADVYNATNPENFLTEEQMKELESRRAWNERYQKHIAEGKTDVEAHQLACGY